MTHINGRKMENTEKHKMNVTQENKAPPYQRNASVCPNREAIK